MRSSGWWRGAVAALLVALAGPAVAEGCPPRDFLAVPLPAGDPVEVALETAYPGLDLRPGAVRLAGRDPARRGGIIRPAAGRAAGAATLGDQFAYRYPLAYDLAPRRTPWVDPGRLRNEAFFRALWFGSEAAARASLGDRGLSRRHRDRPVPGDPEALRRRAARPGASGHRRPRAGDGPVLHRPRRVVQLAARSPGRTGCRSTASAPRSTSTPRSAATGRGPGRSEGRVGDYDSAVPPALVPQMERRGFIWGGKWHHYDGMHFEYRPELILHARLTGG